MSSPPSFPPCVAFVNSNRKWGGVQTWTIDFGTALAACGHRIVVLARGATPFADACRQGGLRFYPVSFGPKYNPLAIARIAAVLRRESADVAVVNISKDVEVGAVAARLCGVPVVRRVGLVEDLRGTFEERLQFRFLVDQILVPGEWMGRALVEQFPWVRSTPVVAIPNSKNLNRFRPGNGSGEAGVVLGVMSQLSPTKGHSCLLEALARMAGSGRQMRLRVAGTGPLEAHLRQQALESGLSDRVEFVGFQRDVPGFLAGLDAFALPSLKEGFPNALLEAMAIGLPIVASDIPGAREMLGHAGLLVAPGEPDALAEALGSLAKDADLRSRLGRAARRRVEERYDLGRNAERLAAFLREVTGQ